MKRDLFLKPFLFSLFFLIVLTVSASAEQAYPQLNISGFKKWEYKKADVSPARNYFTGLTQLGGFYPTFTGSPWQERLQLKIMGELSKDLSVAYDLEQQPETPDKFDVKVKYMNNELTFGDFTANFSGNEFVSASKYLNGVMLTAKDGWYDVITVPSAKLKSQTQALTSQAGNNSRGPYNLGHGGIVEGSEQIQLNGIYLIRNVDYTIDYFEGKITFNRILGTTDQFKYSYEYTNILDIFFPTLSKRDFFGFQSRFTIDPDKFGKPTPRAEAMINTARDNFPTAGSVESDIQEEESSGRYRLKFAPLLNFSETLTFMGTQLKKNEDYLIRYDSGEIKLLTRFLPNADDQLIVEYRYYTTSTEAENIAGIGSRGPYRIAHGDILPESEKIEVDGKTFVRDLDYTLNYKTGELAFGLVISQTSMIKVTYRYNVMLLPPTTTAKFPKELKIGTTYLRESAKKGVGSPQSTIIESYTGQQVIGNNFLLNLKNRPIVPTSEASFDIRLKQGGVSRQLTWEVDYSIPTTEVDPATGFTRVIPNVQLGYITDKSDPSDGYTTGTVYFLNQNLTASDEITVTYTYSKSIVGKYSAVGDGSKGPYYMRNVRQLTPGTETVQVWDQGSSVITTYTRNASFDASAGDTGYSINYNENNPYITFNKELTPTKNFQIIYQYVPPSSNTGGDIAQSAFGVDGSFKIGDVFKIDSSFARSETDQVYTTITTVEPGFGYGTNTFPLNSPGDILDGSEKVYVNLRLLNKDADYFINYTGSPKQITFYNITPASVDAISVEYQYISQNTSGLAATKTKADTAFRLGAETKLFGDTLIINGNTKKVGFDFAPLGSTAIGVGSEYQEYNANFRPDFQSFYTNYSYKFNKSPLGATRNSFLYSYDDTVSAGINPNGLAKVDFGYRTVFTIDDPNSSVHNSDSKQESISGSIAPNDWTKGNFSIGAKYDFRKTRSVNDVVDRTPAYSTSNIDYNHIASNLKFTDRFSAGYDYQINTPVTLGSLETETARSSSTDNSYTFNLDLTPAFLQKLAARVSLLDHQENRTLPTPETTSSTKNETYHFDVTPISILSGSLDHNRQERTSYVTGGENPKNIRTAANARLSPVSWWGMGLNVSKSEAIPETGAAKKTVSRTKGGDMDWTPISSSAFKLSTHLAASNSYQLAPLGSEMVKTDTDTFSKTFTIGLTPIPIVPINIGYTQEDYKNSNNSATSPVTTETQNVTTTVGLSFTPISVLTMNGDYTQKVTRDLLRGTSPTKTNLNAKAAYQITSWGTFSLDWQSEDNKGEVQAGAVANVDYEKQTVTRSLNITIPIDNPALSSFVVQASWKSVNYKNRAKTDGTDDFYAQLISFEGTMNF